MAEHLRGQVPDVFRHRVFAPPQQREGFGADDEVQGAAGAAAVGDELGHLPEPKFLRPSGGGHEAHRILVQLGVDVHRLGDPLEFQKLLRPDDPRRRRGLLGDSIDHGHLLVK